MITKGSICIYREQDSSKNVELHVNLIADKNQTTSYECTLKIGGVECTSDEYFYSESSKKYFKTKRKLWNHINDMISLAKKVNQVSDKNEKSLTKKSITEMETHSSRKWLDFYERDSTAMKRSMEEFEYLQRLKNCILFENGLIHLKKDDEDFFDYVTLPQKPATLQIDEKTFSQFVLANVNK
jgi:hypothetical protein